MNENGWKEYQKLVLDKLETLEAGLACVDKKVGNLRVDVAQLKVKAGVFGALAGFLGAAGPVLAGLAVYLLR